MEHSRGFTIVELIVVIAIISVLSTVLFVNLNGVRDEAKNQALQATLQEMQIALEVYKSENGAYPNNLAGLIPDYIVELPASNMSGNEACSINYDVAPDNSWYKISANRCLAGADDASEGIGEDEEFALCPSSCGTCSGNAYNTSYTESAVFYESMSIYSSGGQCE